ncbi:sodium/hydrogen exchanger 10-like [Centruroides sculpturatus]|uniref:sodium/hydrogen exchanger 10-like n=2 Tax=Centruroides sculpturatus TaxID=218467 RepID=UPI000C6EB300|nr:sodium/hydrogen exchanger 10-like [Centruroides sculpturatus]
MYNFSEWNDTVWNDTEWNNVTSIVHHKMQPYSILFLFVSIALGALVRFLLKKIRLPYTVVLLVCGALFGLASSRFSSLEKYTQITRMDPHVILHVFLPILIFESAFALDAHTFLRCFAQCLILSVPGLIVSSALTAVLSYKIFSEYQWNWATSFLFGTILSATDPVAVVALLRELGTSKSLSTIIEGESLLNDGSAIVAYDILRELVVPGTTVTATQIFLKFCQIALGGPALGFIVGKLAVFCLSHIFNDAVIEITVTLSAAYLTYYLAEVVLHVSGVLAVVILGVVISADEASISPEVEGFVHRFWEMLSYLANTVIFIVVGLVITERAASHIEEQDWFHIIVTYIGATVFRLVMIVLFSPLLSRLGYGLKWQEVIVMTWGGLRGAVGLALALLVAQQEGIDPELVGHKILIHVAGIVTLTLLFNATTIKPLLKLLGMSDISYITRCNMAIAVQHLKEVRENSLHAQRNAPLVADADWKFIEKFTIIEDPYGRVTKKDEDKDTTAFTPLRQSMCPDCNNSHVVEPSAKELEEMSNEANLRMLAAQKVSYWRQFDHGLLGQDTVLALIGAADVAADKGGHLSVEDLRYHWQISGIYTCLIKLLRHRIKPRNQTQSERKHIKEYHRHLNKLVTSHIFQTFVYLVLFFNVILIIMEIISYANPQSIKFGLGISELRFINCGFVAFYVLEMILKVIGLGFWNYWNSHWNKFDFIILILQFVDMLIDICFHYCQWYDTRSTTYLIVSRSFRLIRITRMFRIFKCLINGLANFVDGRINVQLYAGFDICCGFLIGQEEVMKVLDSISSYPPITNQLKKICEETRLQILKELSQLQEEHPGVAVAVKTRHASRQTLNNVRTELNELKELGLLEDGVYNKLNSERAEVICFSKGCTIEEAGDEPSGIYVITVGLVKVVGRIEPTQDGSLLNVDSFHWFPNQQELEDYLTVGKLLGELGILTGKPRSTSAIADTEVQAFYISYKDMMEALKTFRDDPSLEYKIWRSCSLRIAKHVLRNHPDFQEWSCSRILMHLSRAYVPDTRKLNTLDLASDVEDVILVQGMASDPQTNELYRGVCYIPCTVRTLIFPQDCKVKPLIVLIGNVDYTLDPNLDWSGGTEAKLNQVQNKTYVITKSRRRPSSRPWTVRSPSEWSMPEPISEEVRQRFNFRLRANSADPSENERAKSNHVYRMLSLPITYDNPAFTTSEDRHNDQEETTENIPFGTINEEQAIEEVTIDMQHQNTVNETQNSKRKFLKFRTKEK